MKAPDEIGYYISIRRMYFAIFPLIFIVRSWFDTHYHLYDHDL